MKKAYNNCLHRYIKLVLKPGLIMELILICILVSLHGYTDNVTDNTTVMKKGYRYQRVYEVFVGND